MSFATTAPAQATAARYHAPDEHVNARLREAAARIATSLAHFAATHSRRSRISESPILVEDVVAGGEAHRVRGEVLTLASGTPVVLVTVHRHPTGHPSHDLLRAAYRLTSVESRVATLLAARMSNREVAQLLGVTEHTARRHTERVLHKLGVNQRTAVRRELLRCLERSQANPPSAEAPGEGRNSGGGTPRQPEGEAGRAPAGEAHGVGVGMGVARWLVVRPRIRRAGKRRTRDRRSKERVIAFLSREPERQAVRDALGEEAVVQFAAELKELHPPWVGAAPVAVLAELEREGEQKLESALRRLQRTAPAMPVWVYAPRDRVPTRLAMRFATRGLIVDAITTLDELEARTRALLSDAREWSEGEALWRVWEPWLAPATREIVAECIEASVRNVSTNRLARSMNTSTRSLSRRTTQAKLPSVQRMLALCRLLRAMHRLDHRVASIKAIAMELGYPSAAALRMQLTYVTELRFSRMKAGAGFAALAELVHAEMRELRESAAKPTQRGKQRRRSGTKKTRKPDAAARNGKARNEPSNRESLRKPKRRRGRNS